MPDKVGISDQAETLLRFLRRIGAHEIATALNGAHEDLARFEQASERLRVALAKAIASSERARYELQ